MTNPRFYGQDEKGRAYVVGGKEAVRDAAGGGHVILTLPVLKLATGPDKTMDVSARNGLFDLAAKVAYLTNQVHMVDSGSGWVFDTSEAQVNSKTGDITGNHLVTGHGPSWDDERLVLCHSGPRGDGGVYGQRAFPHCPRGRPAEREREEKTMNRTWIIGMAAVVALVTASVAQAQLSTKNGPIDITSDHFSADNPANTATYDGHVVVLQDDNRLRSDNMVIFFQPRSATPAPKATTGSDDATPMSSKIDHLVAAGNVYFVTPTQVIRGDKAVWTKATDTIVVTGQVVVTQGENVKCAGRDWSTSAPRAGAPWTLTRAGCAPCSTRTRSKNRVTERLDRKPPSFLQESPTTW